MGKEFVISTRQFVSPLKGSNAKIFRKFSCFFRIIPIDQSEFSSHKLVGCFLVFQLHGDGLSTGARAVVYFGYETVATVVKKRV